MLDKLAESAAKQQELNEENNKLKDQLKSYQDKLKCVLIIKKYVFDFQKHSSCEFESCWWLGVLDTKLCDKVC